MTPKEPSARRRALLVTVATVFVGLGVIPLSATPAFACSCVGGMTDQQYAAAADVVFVGRVDDAVSDGTSATFVVDEVYKGDAEPYTDVVTANDGVSCGLEFVRGRTMVVFARYGGDGLIRMAPTRLTANLCDGTRVVDASPVTMSSPGYAPVASINDAGDEGGFPLIGWLSYVAVAGLGLMPLALWLRLLRTARSR